MTEVPYPVFYKGVRLPSLYRADFLCMEAVMVEIKSLPVRTGKVEQAQMLKYLRASGLKRRSMRWAKSRPLRDRTRIVDLWLCSEK